MYIQAWSPEEDQLLIEAHQIYGNKWAEIAKVLSGKYSSYTHVMVD